MSPDFSGLSDLAKEPARAVKGQWQPLTPADLGSGRVLFFDQSLTATGWVKVVSMPGLTQVVDAGTFKAPGGDNSMETQFTRGVAVFEQAVALLARAVPEGYSLAHESPPNPAQMKSKGGGVASMLAAQSVRNACAVYDITPTMLGALPGKKLVSGLDSKASKAQVHAVLKETCFPWIEGSNIVTNEHTRDALIGALLYLYRQPRTAEEIS